MSHSARTWRLQTMLWTWCISCGASSLEESGPLPGPGPQNSSQARLRLMWNHLDRGILSNGNRFKWTRYGPEAKDHLDQSGPGGYDLWWTRRIWTLMDGSSAAAAAAATESETLGYYGPRTSGPDGRRIWSRSQWFEPFIKSKLEMDLSITLKT
ncbi:hypothetical protein AVEN_121539-1 [Araneus ventricosus]|uniref:Fibrinogen C-terminal domain-containing protein n=1 Tax=Araneus ventricosus TaxID=182803 RepID=A0A4Y2GM11_ARAVE|nr:hypothetical protein AVEN_121539-1 [Araneus ventricosus]